MTEDDKMDMQEPPAIVAPGHLTFRSVELPPPNTVLTITKDGKKMRGDKEVKDLTHDELLLLVDDLIGLIKRR